MTDETHVIWTRRDFVRGTVGAALVAPLVAPALAGEPQAPRRPGRAATVTIVREAQALGPGHEVDQAAVRRMLAEVVTRVTGERTPKAAWLSMVKPTDMVGLVSTDHLNPTHQEVIDAVRDGLIEAGIPAGRIVPAQGRIDRARSCTALIALPALKAHWLTGLGTAMKLYIMYSGNASLYHDANNANLAETWLLPDVKGKTKMVLVDALRPLCDKGPQPDPRYLWHYNGLVGGIDPVAVDAVCLQIIMEKRRELRGEPWPLSPPPLCVSAARREVRPGHEPSGGDHDQQGRVGGRGAGVRRILCCAVALLPAVLVASSQQAAVTDPVVTRALAIHQRAITIDTHVDIGGANYATPALDPGAADHDLKCDLTKMEKGGLDGVFLAVFVGQGPLDDRRLQAGLRPGDGEVRGAQAADRADAPEPQRVRARRRPTSSGSRRRASA